MSCKAHKCEVVFVFSGVTDLRAELESNDWRQWSVHCTRRNGVGRSDTLKRRGPRTIGFKK